MQLGGAQRCGAHGCKKGGNMTHTPGRGTVTWHVWPREGRRHGAAVWRVQLGGSDDEVHAAGRDKAIWPVQLEGARQCSPCCWEGHGNMACVAARCVVRWRGGRCGWEGHYEKARAAGRGAAVWPMWLGGRRRWGARGWEGCGDMACAVVRGMASWGSNSGKAQAQQKSVSEEITHLKEPKIWLLAVE